MISGEIGVDPPWMDSDRAYFARVAPVKLIGEQNIALRGVGGQVNGLLASKLTSLLCKDVSSEKSNKVSQNHLSIISITLIENKGRKP